MIRVFGRSIVLLGVALLIGAGFGCAAHQSPQTTPSEVFAGHIAVTPNGAWFTPCGDPATSKWWVTFTEVSVAQAERAKGGGLLGAAPTFVRWRAVRTNESQVGPGGPALLVREILEVRAPAANDCAAPSATGDASHLRSVRADDV